MLGYWIGASLGRSWLGTDRAREVAAQKRRRQTARRRAQAQQARRQQDIQMRLEMDDWARRYLAAAGQAGFTQQDLRMIEQRYRQTVTLTTAEINQRMAHLRKWRLVTPVGVKR